jgi:hypothetical protein
MRTRGLPEFAAFDFRKSGNPTSGAFIAPPAISVEIRNRRAATSACPIDCGRDFARAADMG